MKRLIAVGLAILSLLTVANAELLADPIRIDKVERDGRHSLTLYNRSQVPVTYRLTFELTNAEIEDESKLVIVVPPKGRAKGPVILRTDDRYSWNWRYNSWYNFGDIAPKITETSYELPFSKGTRHKILQGFHGKLSHKAHEAYALDFDLPEGTEVRAARAGLVVEVKEDFTRGGWDPTLKEFANTVIVAHTDGTLARYVHLKKNGAVVDPGQWVNSGDLIGYSGNTGLSTGPHLHFDVYHPKGKETLETIKFKLRVNGRIVEPLEGEFYQNN